MSVDAPSPVFTAAQQFFEKLAGSASREKTARELVESERAATVAKHRSELEEKVAAAQKYTDERYDSLSAALSATLAATIRDIGEVTTAKWQKVEETLKSISAQQVTFESKVGSTVRRVAGKIAELEARISAATAAAVVPAAPTPAVVPAAAAAVVPVAPTPAVVVAPVHPYDSAELAKEIAAAAADQTLHRLDALPKAATTPRGPGFVVADSPYGRGSREGRADIGEHAAAFLSKHLLGGFDLAGHSLVLAGGAVTSLVYNEGEPKDYDLFFVGEQNASSIKTVISAYAEHAKRVTGDKVCVNCTVGCYTVVDRKTRTHVQFILRHNPTALSVIQDFDLGSCMYLWDGKAVHTNGLGLLAAKYRVNVLNPGRVRYSYWSRIAKYFDRGFGLVLPYCKELPAKAEIGKLTITSRERYTFIESWQAGVGTNGEPFSYDESATYSNLMNPAHLRSQVEYINRNSLYGTQAVQPTCVEDELTGIMCGLVAGNTVNVAKCRKALGEQNFASLMKVKVDCTSKQAEMARLTELFLSPAKIAGRAAAIRAQVIPFVIKKQGEDTAASEVLSYRDIYGALYYE